MKRILYGLVLISLSACNSKSTNQTQTTTPSELSGLQTSAKPTIEQQSGLLTNPEHGKPGHDCALPVGAPLAQQKKLQQAVATPSVTPTAVVTPKPEAPKPTNTQKINPAHGQLGHDCAVPVGAPLTQKNNAQKVAAPTTTITSTPQPVAPKPSSGQKINPAHGQPGHDCAVPVGSPLS